MKKSQNIISKYCDVAALPGRRCARARQAAPWGTLEVVPAAHGAGSFLWCHQIHVHVCHDTTWTACNSGDRIYRNCKLLMKSNAKEQTHCDNFNDINAHTLCFRDDGDVIRHGRHFVVLRLLTSRLNAAFVVFGTVKLWNDGLTFLVRRVRMLGRKWSINGDLTVSVTSSFKHIPARQILAPPRPATYFCNSYDL